MIIESQLLHEITARRRIKGYLQLNELKLDFIAFDICE